ncbi:Asp-tRNA(Asn)/Glu-tRNA(Gln) amidotransferase subunit GatA [Candidatus Saccharibacteria bacterium]|nr:Asp-tRNA(Asn)/Glu-tRNA(Gln) amidotransferase subunit GatA [Candidatus Saccharibacteria bacterium]
MKIADKTTSAVSLIKTALSKAEQYKDYNIFTFLNTEAALKKAQEIDDKIKRGEKVGRLAGVPYALKDNFLSREGETTASAKILTGLKSPLDATCVEKLEKEGAIMLGRTNLDAFAHGSSTENSFFGPTKNAYDPTRVAGGSSGGSAVAVALDIVQFATGTDTGGSIRQPASFNGVYGIKPTYGTISRYGVVAMASSTDVIGFFAKTTSDLDLLMTIASGKDEKDMTTLPDFYGSADEKLNKKSLGFVKEFLESPALSKELRSALEKKLALARDKGYDVVELSLPTLEYALAVYYIIQPAEVASNLSRYDGVRYGFRTKNLKNPEILSADETSEKTNKKSPLDLLYENTRSEGFMRENKRRIMIGNFVLSSGFFDAYFLKAAKARTLIIREFDKAFTKVDAILTPSAPNPAFRLGEKVNDPVSMYLEDVMSVPVNLAGLPSVAFPVGFTEDKSYGTPLPLGLQLIGPRRSDKNLIKLIEDLS